MNKVLKIIILLLVPIVSFAQIKVKGKIINPITEKGAPNLDFYVIQNNDKWIDISETNENGRFIFTLSDDELDSLSSYQIRISDDKYVEIGYDFDPFEKLKLKIIAEVDTSYIPRDSLMVYLGCTYTSYGFYYPRKPNSLSELPADIHSKIENHLLSRLGEKFYNRLSLTDGEIVDVNRLHIVDPNTLDFRWRPYTYNLCFTFRDTTIGIGLFTAEMVLDSLGDIIDEIQLPNVANNLTKHNIISLAEARLIAIRENHFQKGTVVEIDYDKDYDSIVWLFIKTNYNDNNEWFSSTLKIDAHTGDILDVDEADGFWIR